LGYRKKKPGMKPGKSSYNPGREHLRKVMTNELDSFNAPFTDSDWLFKK
jgi:hypothetical protein